MSKLRQLLNQGHSVTTITARNFVFFKDEFLLLQLTHQPTNSLNKIQFMTSIKLHVSAHGMPSSGNFF